MKPLHFRCDNGALTDLIGLDQCNLENRSPALCLEVRALLDAKADESQEVMLATIRKCQVQPTQLPTSYVSVGCVRRASETFAIAALCIVLRCDDGLRPTAVM